MSRRRYFSQLPTAPPPTQEISLLRVLGMGVSLSVLFAILVGRLWLLQMVRGDDYRERALLNRSRTTRTTAPRGVIKDSKGRILVDNTTQFAVFLHPDEMPRPAKLKTTPKKKGKGQPTPAPLPPEELNPITDRPLDPVTKIYLNRVAELVEVPVAELYKIIKKKRGRAGDPIPIREDIDRGLMARLYEQQDDLSGLSVDVIPVRAYRYLKRATHILGYTRPIDADDLKDPNILAYPAEKRYRGGDWIGKQGLEKQYDRYLRGTLGYESFEVDGKGHRRKEVGKEPAKAGDNLILALDATIQDTAEKALGGRPGAVVAVDPRSGRILAMASAPTYDLGLWTRPRTQADVVAMQKGGAELNRAVSKYPPGSTFKIVTMAAGLASHRLPDGAYCPGYVQLGKIKKKCMGHHGGIDSISAFAQSCNVFFFEAGWKIGDEILADWAHRFGLGSKTGIDLPNEKQGTIPSKQWARETKDRGWWRGDLADMAIGQGFDEATPLQMALVAAAVGNGGTVWKPYLVDKVVDSDDPNKVLFANKPEVAHTLELDKNALQRLRSAMHAVVERGTSRAAALPGIDVAGKSGTAQTGRGNMAHGWFTCYAGRSGEAPKIAVCVLLEATQASDNFHGGGVCAPIARAVIEAYFSAEKAAAQSASVPGTALASGTASESGTDDEAPRPRRRGRR